MSAFDTFINSVVAEVTQQCQGGKVHEFASYGTPCPEIPVTRANVDTPSGAVYLTLCAGHRDELVTLADQAARGAA